MPQPERQTRSYLMRLFERHGFHPRHDLGQNFLIDLNIIEFVVASAELTLDDVVLEIGTGTGGMTTFMAQEAAHVLSVDIDRNMHRLAADVTADFDNITLLTRDALKNKNHFAPEVLDKIQELLGAAPGRRLKLVANLPYAVATPVISNLVASDLPWARMVVTIQYELGQRMQADPTVSNYGALSVWLQSQCRVTMLKKVGPQVFWPRPKVDSAIMDILPDPDRAVRIGSRAFFHDYGRRVFNQRRKLLRKVLTGMYDNLSREQIEALIQEAGLTESARAEEIPVDTHIVLANRLQQILGDSSIDTDN